MHNTAFNNPKGNLQEIQEKIYSDEIAFIPLGYQMELLGSGVGGDITVYKDNVTGEAYSCHSSTQYYGFDSVQALHDYYVNVCGCVVSYNLNEI